MKEKNSEDEPTKSGVKMSVSTDKNDIQNYTEVKSDFFDQVYKDMGNEEEILKIMENGRKKHPRYYVWTDFLISEEY